MEFYELQQMVKYYKLGSWLGTIGAIIMIGVIFCSDMADVFDGMGLDSIGGKIVLLFGIVSVCLLGAGIYIRLKGCNQAEFKRKYKELFVVKELEKHFDNVKYFYDHGFTRMEVEEFYLVPLGNRFHSEDLLMASYRGVDFRMSDVRVEHHVKSGKSSTTYIYFSGVIFDFVPPYANKLEQNMQIKTKNPGFAVTATKKEPPNIFAKNIQMESVEFNKLFSVSCMTDHFAFYILTPPVMEKIMEIQRKYGSFIMSICNGHIYFGVQDMRKDMFDTNLMLKINHEFDYMQEKEKTQMDIAYITEIIHLLDLIQENV